MWKEERHRSKGFKTNQSFTVRKYAKLGEVGGGVEASCIYIFTNAIALYKSVLVVGE